MCVLREARRVWGLGFGLKVWGSGFRVWDRAGGQGKLELQLLRRRVEKVRGFYVRACGRSSGLGLLIRSAKRVRKYNPKPLKVGRIKGPLYKDSYFGIISPVEFFGRCRAVRHSLSHEVLYGEHEVHERAGGARGMA